MYAETQECPRMACREAEAAAAMMSMQRSSPHDPHYGTGQSMERILKRYQACNSIHITSHLFSDPRSCAASRKAPTTSSRWTPVTLRKTSRKQYSHYQHHNREKDTPAFAGIHSCIWGQA